MQLYSFMVRRAEEETPLLHFIVGVNEIWRGRLKWKSLLSSFFVLIACLLKQIARSLFEE